ncbi:pentapeptide repeat-containing protein [Pyxidicoccus fallax]|uniref:Pentapeptide repeat-containing protein n=1 Tax=Pyxidicoccus fallax TaxID=394095 RepID=A0A848LDV5_9BACT|nr:pentapeptide repeat-containing protein [Pyxidicoccus fallax]NMO14411.1 pentapeptide repeat-containing protein [Pyxidicoccus fallax]NPC77578.1 pentapeptide repeat-containing protein [Pyxidicoccus fallax]
MRADELVARWNTADGQRRRERLISMGFQGPWREVLAGFPGTESLGDNLGDLRGIDLTQQELTGADLVRARMDGARLDDCGLQEARLELATLSGASLTWARLDRANLTTCVALGTRWEEASLEGAVLTASNLTRSSFRRARLREARFDGASLCNADLRNSDLRNTSLRFCDLEGALLTCAQWDPPRAYLPGERDFARHAREAGFPSFIEPLLMMVSVHDLTHLRRDALRHVEAGVDASSNLEAEVSALWKQKRWGSDLLAATAMVLGGASERTLAALWEHLDRDHGSLPHLTVTALLRDPDFANRARERLKPVPPTRLELALTPLQTDVRACLQWALELRENSFASSGAPARGSARRAYDWLTRLREQVEPRIQATWLK